MKEILKRVAENLKENLTAVARKHLRGGNTNAEKWENMAGWYGESYSGTQWKLLDNPCEGENYRNMFQGQSAYIFEKDGRLTVTWCESPEEIF